MSGILDSKQRILDTIVTAEGKKQLSNGGINVKFVSFTDSSTFYKADLENGNEDVTKRIYFEACNLPSDQITFKSNSDGNIGNIAAENSDTFLKNGNILTTVISSSLSKPLVQYSAISGNDFHEQADKILSTSYRNFQRNKMLSTADSFFEDDQFQLNTNKTYFQIKKDRPIDTNQKKHLNISSIPNVFNDIRLSNKQNFKYLPPVNKLTDESIDRDNFSFSEQFSLGSYPKWKPDVTLKAEDILRDISEYANSGYVKNLVFSPTSKNNNLFFQIFEETNSEIKKLDIIDFGFHSLSDGIHEEIKTSFNTKINPGKHVHIFFVGKILTDPQNQTDKFVHIFTLIFG